MNDVMVVGDRFAAFAHRDGVLTVSALVRSLADMATADDRLTVRCGQGVGVHERAFLRAAVDRHGLADRVTIAGDAPDPAGRDLVHKHRPANVLLADVRQDGDGFGARLCLSGDNELLQDHQTGEHVPGIVVVEAVRQMSLAVVELRYGRTSGTSWTVVWDGLDLRFTSFLFPLPGLLRCRVEEAAGPRRPDRVRCTMDVTVVQGEREVATARMACTAFEAGRLAAAERSRATRALHEFLPPGDGVCLPSGDVAPRVGEVAA